MLTPDDIVADLWDALVAGPPQWGRPEGHPMAHGLLRALGLLFLPLGFAAFLVGLIFFVATFAVIYDIAEVTTRPFRPDRRRRG